MRIKLLAVMCFLLVLAVKAEIAFVADYAFGWEQRPSTAKISSYWIFRRVPPSPIYNVVAVVGNTNTATVSNVTTIIHYEWAVAPSNSLGLGELSEIVPTPANPGRIRNARLTSVRMVVPQNAVIEASPTLSGFTNRFVIMNVKGNQNLFSYQLEAHEPAMFWRWRAITNPAMPVLPQ